MSGAQERRADYAAIAIRYAMVRGNNAPLDGKGYFRRAPHRARLRRVAQGSVRSLGPTAGPTLPLVRLSRQAAPSVPARLPGLCGPRVRDLLGLQRRASREGGGRLRTVQIRNGVAGAGLVEHAAALVQKVDRCAAASPALAKAPLRGHGARARPVGSAKWPKR